MTVIVAASGYRNPASGGLIREIEAAEQVEGVTVFHAGTALGDAASWRRADGSSQSPRSPRFRQRARASLSRGGPDRFADGFHRRDIGWRELARDSA